MSYTHEQLALVFCPHKVRPEAVIDGRQQESIDNCLQKLQSIDQELQTCTNNNDWTDLQDRRNLWAAEIRDLL